MAKILMQDLWILGADWDQQLPENVCTVWQRFGGSLVQLDALKIARWMFASSEPSTHMELHGFCDASQRAYAAAVYTGSAAMGLNGNPLLPIESPISSAIYRWTTGGTSALWTIQQTWRPEE